MKTKNHVYKMTDVRRGAVPLHPVVAIQQIAGGLEVHSLSGHGFAFNYNEDSDNEDDEPVTSFPENDNLVLNMRQGKVVLQLLTLDLYRAEMQHTMTPEVPDFKSDEEMSRYFYNQIALSSGAL